MIFFSSGFSNNNKKKANPSLIVGAEVTSVCAVAQGLLTKKRKKKDFNPFEGGYQRRVFSVPCLTAMSSIQAQMAWKKKKAWTIEREKKKNGGVHLEAHEVAAMCNKLNVHTTGIQLCRNRDAFGLSQIN